MKLLVSLFPVWVLAASIVALVHPPAFTWFRGPFITIGLGLIMLGMGLTLTVEDFGRVVRAPRPILLGVALQYTVMPALGYGIGVAMGLPRELAVGLVLVACCPGGTASNVIAFIARADVALSVSMTAVSTMLAVAATPVLTTVLVGSRVEVDPLGLFMSTVQVVLLPVGLGLVLRRFAGRMSARIVPVAPVVAVVAIVLIVASIIGAGRAQIMASGLRLVGAVALMHALGFAAGYGLCRALGQAIPVARTVSIEVGMQNSGLGVVLARNNFASPMVAIPAAISSLFHSLIGSVLAGYWRRRG
ncbi:MAG: bile acid:sodium symporter family protein [Myxococcota bacterium]